VVNIAFTVIDEGERANSVLGNHTVAILKVDENYKQLAAGLQDIISDAKDCNAILIDGQKYNVEFYLGGDLKFLAIVCGLEAANAEYACIWCKCPKGKRDDMTMEWSLTDVSKGARTIEEIAEKSTLGKQRYNCRHLPLFRFIPIERVIIDTLHLFLRISDNLTDLLIRDLKAQDDLDKKRRRKHDKTNLEMYATHLNETCKIRFKWSEDTKELKYRDLTGPEKIRLFKNTDLCQQFPRLPNNDKINQLWSNFFTIINDINKEDNDYDEINIKTKAWVNNFTSIYQAKDVSPYIHSFAMHIPEFLRLYGNISTFNQQGLEKLNDITTKQFQRSTNVQALQQILQKRNRIELLEDQRFQRVKNEQKCNICKKMWT